MVLIPKLFNCCSFKVLKIAGMLLLPAILLFLPYNYFDGGEIKCLSRILLDIECWGCGMTRACMRIIHLRWHEAWLFNPRSFIVFPILCYLYTKELYVSWKNLKN